MGRIRQICETFARLLVVGALISGGPVRGGGELVLRSGAFPLAEPAEALRLEEELAAAEGAAVVQFTRMPGAARLAELRALGIGVLDFLPPAGYLVRLPPGGLDGLAGLRGLAGIAVLAPRMKLLLRSGELPEDALYVAHGFPDRGPEELCAAVRRAAGGLVWCGGPSAAPRAVVRGGPELPPLLAALPEVLWVTAFPEITLRNDVTRWVVQSNVPEWTSVWEQGIRGEGEVLGLIDTKLDPGHCLFRDLEGDPPGPGHRKLAAYASEAGWGPPYDAHGTHVAGTLAGDQRPVHGVDTGNGMAPGALIAFFDLDDIRGFGSQPSNLLGALEENDLPGARVHNLSWGDDGTTAYTGFCRDIDLYSHDREEALVVVAVSNREGIRSPENAKNCLAVAATWQAPRQGERGLGGVGPTEDGRRKPDLLAPGMGIRSANVQTECELMEGSGSSFAAPAVAGCAALVRQYFRAGFYPEGAPYPENALEPLGALVRAVLVNSAVRLDDAGSYPSNRDGWGRVLLERALLFAGDERGLVVRQYRHSAGLADGDARELILLVHDAEEDLRVTLCWQDRPAALGAEEVVVNDLDLVVDAPSFRYRGNVIDPATGWSLPGGEADRLNNVEQVLVAAPEPGLWRVRVGAPIVPLGPQGYALAISGPVAEPLARGLVRLDRPAYGCADRARVWVLDADPAGSGELEVTARAGEQQTVLRLAETELEGVFEGWIALGEELPVSHGEELEITYIDADDGHGHANVPCTATAAIDCQAPWILDLAFEPESAAAGVLRWRASEPVQGAVEIHDQEGLVGTYETTAWAAEQATELAGLVPCSGYRAVFVIRDRAGNETVDDGGGGHGFWTPREVVVFQAEMDQDPGWRMEGLWAWGDPLGQGGSAGGPDPNHGVNGELVVGYNLEGDYPPQMEPESLTAGPFEVAGLSRLVLEYQRWLGVQAAPADRARVECSVDGVTWLELWANPEQHLYDGSWTAVSHELDPLLPAGAEQVELRWVMGPTDEAYQFCGWNLDEVRLTGLASCAPSPSPTPAVTPTPTPSPAATATPEGPPLTVELLLSAEVFQAGDRFVLGRSVENRGAALSADEYLILDVHGEYWFWPSWSRSLDAGRATVPPGGPQIEVRLDFLWPQGAGSGSDIAFWCAFTEPAGFELLSNVARVAFDFR
jgi:subtilisin family serine protease